MQDVRAEMKKINQFYKFKNLSVWADIAFIRKVGAVVQIAVM
jgi:hypothetical protein